MPKVDMEAEIQEAERRVNGLGREAKQIAGAQKKKYGEFETINGALYEGKDLIEGNQKKLKREKNTKKREALESEIEAMGVTFKKMTAKIGPVVKALEGSGDDAADLQGRLKEELQTLKDLGNSLKRTGGDLEQLKEWASDIKALIKKVGAIQEVADQAADLPNTMPNIARL